jgi:hypothetical protein
MRFQVRETKLRMPSWDNVEEAINFPVFPRELLLSLCGCVHVLCLRQRMRLSLCLLPSLLFFLDMFDIYDDWQRERDTQTLWHA